MLIRVLILVVLALLIAPPVACRIKTNVDLHLRGKIKKVDTINCFSFNEKLCKLNRGAKEWHYLRGIFCEIFTIKLLHDDGLQSCVF